MNNAPNIQIEPHDWEEVRRILERHVPQYDVAAFGSRATWTARTFSDLDLVIMTKARLPLETMADLKAAFDESDLRIKVDILDWAGTSETFREVIDRSRIVIQEGQRGHGLLQRPSSPPPHD